MDLGKVVKENKHIWIIPVYIVFYLVAFTLLEMSSQSVNIIHCSLDDKIPFCEYFIVPYVAWYFFLAATVVYFVLFVKSRVEYWQFVGASGAGLTLFLIFSFIYPNGLNIRPVLSDGNIFVQAVKLLYQIDTATNVLPSMHVYMSIACCAALCENREFANHKNLALSTKILTVLICISTMFIKQHSVIDVTFGIVLYALCYQIFYKILPQYKEMIVRIFNRKEIFTIPNILTMIRLVLAVAFLGIYVRCGGTAKNRILLTGILVISGITDFLDGKIARRFNMVSEVGKLLDPAADKVTQGVLLLCLFSQYKIAIPVFGLFLVKESYMLVNGMETIAVTGNNDGAKWYGKVSTAVFYVVMVVLVMIPEIPENIGNILIMISGSFMLLAFVMYAKLFKELQAEHVRVRNHSTGSVIS